MNLIKDINNAIRSNKNKPITIRASDIFIYDVFGARKYPGGQAGTIEPHTDIILDKRAGKKTNISLKQGPLSSLTKGNARGLEAIIPGIIRKLSIAALNKLKQINIEDGERVPPIFGHLQELDKERLFVGKTSTGGPVDYLYIGNGTTQYDEDEELLSIDGNLVDPISYVKKRDFYLKMMPLYDDQVFDSKLSVGGIPKIYDKSKDHKISENIIILTEDVSEDGIVVEIV
jgi:hypothetical protein